MGGKRTKKKTSGDCLCGMQRQKGSLDTRTNEKRNASYSIAARLLAYEFKEGQVLGRKAGNAANDRADEQRAGGFGKGVDAKLLDVVRQHQATNEAQVQEQSRDGVVLVLDFGLDEDGRRIGNGRRVVVVGGGSIVVIVAGRKVLRQEAVVYR